METRAAEADGVVPKDNPPDALSPGLSTGASGFVGVPNENEDSAGFADAESPKVKPPAGFDDSLIFSANVALGGSILPRPVSLIGLLISAEIPLNIGPDTSSFFSSTFGGASVVSLFITDNVSLGRSSSSSSL